MVCVVVCVFRFVLLRCDEQSEETSLFVIVMIQQLKKKQFQKTIDGLTWLGIYWLDLE